MSESIDVDAVMYHHAKAVEFARTYLGCENVVSEADARKLESERDALQARVTSLQCLLDQRWEMMRELEEVCETKDVAKAVEYIKGLKARVQRLEEAGDAMKWWCCEPESVEQWNTAKESKP